jgi:type III secretory pathway component EscS
MSIYHRFRHAKERSDFLQRTVHMGIKLVKVAAIIFVSVHWRILKGPHQDLASDYVIRIQATF